MVALADVLGEEIPSWPDFTNPSSLAFAASSA
jgi:hypothetical protein